MANDIDPCVLRARLDGLWKAADENFDEIWRLSVSVEPVLDLLDENKQIMALATITVAAELYARRIEMAAAEDAKE